MTAFILSHTHRFGTSTTLFESELDYYELLEKIVPLARALSIDYEPELGEELELESVNPAANITAADLAHHTIATDACAESPDGEHSFQPDLEYDPTGGTINCEYCGEGSPLEEETDASPIDE
jgi:hypothetical protein